MFGSKKSKFEERMKKAFEQICKERVTFEKSLTQVEKDKERLYNDVSQIVTNIEDIASDAMRNIQEESVTMKEIDDFSQELRVAVEEYKQIQSEIEHQSEVATALVEDNKHFTSPAKYLSEVPAYLNENCQSYEKQLTTMEDYGKKMGVLALNAAIEAGRLGESGRQFVLAAEEIRQTAVAYEKAATSMKQEVEASHIKVAEMEETILHLISLLKENNMGTAKLFKKCKETQKSIRKSSMRDFSEDLILIRDKVVNMRNLDEEISKSAERNKIQLEDILEDIQNQKHEIAEMESDLLHLLDLAEEQLN